VIGCGVSLLVLAAIAAWFDARAEAAIIAGITIVGLWVAWQGSASLRTRGATGVAALQRIHDELLQTQHSAAALADAMRHFAAEEALVRVHATRFCELVDCFELLGLRRSTFAPAPPMDRRSDDELVRADTAKAAGLNVEIDAELLPVRLRFVVESSGPKSKYWLARRVKSGDGDCLSRSAAYFHERR